MTDTKGSTPKSKLLRQCVACRQMKEKRELIRIVRTPDGRVAIDESGRMNGRGAYLCRSAECLARASKARSLEKSLRAAVPQTLYEALSEEMGE